MKSLHKGRGYALAHAFTLLFCWQAASFAFPAFGEPPFPGIGDKTMVVWCTVADALQRGGGVVTLEANDRFDSIVFGECAQGRWMTGSELWKRTETDQAACSPETAGPEELLQIAAVYRGSEVSLYRNGNLYSRHHAAGQLSFEKSVSVLMGLRHRAMAHEPSAHFSGSIEESRLYGEALDQAVLRDLRPGDRTGPRPLAMWTFEDGTTKDGMGLFPDGRLLGGAYIEGGRLHLDGEEAYMETSIGGPKALDFVHFRPARERVGDVIPFYWDGVYHVFYLKGSGWGHITTRDLVHWRELPDALARGKEPGAPDGACCWTGSIVEHDGVFHLFYTGNNPEDPLGDQKVMRATSSDLVAWTKQPASTFYADGKYYWNRASNASIDDKQIPHHRAFRDPDVFWNPEAKAWWMALHAVLADGSNPAFALYSSEDLINWTPMPPLLVFPPSVSGDCPQVFYEQGKWYIIAADRHYTAAERVGGPYSPDMQPFGAGELFVPKTMSDGNRRILLGWIGDREEKEDGGKGVWGGVMCMARELYADARGRLRQRPVKEVVAAFSAVFPVPAAPEALTSIGVPPDFMLQVSLVPETTTATASIIMRHSDHDPASGYRLHLDFASGEAALEDNHRRYARDCELDPDQPVSVTAFAVGNVIEVFVNEAFAFTMRGYDRPEGQLTLQLSGARVANDSLRVQLPAGASKEQE